MNKITFDGGQIAESVFVYIRRLLIIRTSEEGITEFSFAVRKIEVGIALSFRVRLIQKQGFLKHPFFVALKSG